MVDGISRDEMSGRLEAAEARTEARFSQMMVSLEGRFGQMDGRFAQNEIRFARIDAAIGTLTETVVRLVTEIQTTRAEAQANKVELQTEIRGVRTELQAEILDSRAEQRTTRSDLASAIRETRSSVMAELLASRRHAFAMRLTVIVTVIGTGIAVNNAILQGYANQLSAFQAGLAAFQASATRSAGASGAGPVQPPKATSEHSQPDTGQPTRNQ